MAKRVKAIEMFLALGLAVTLTACDNAAEVGGESGEVAETVPHEMTSGGEGGEGGEGGASGNPEVDYMTTLALMKGHLIVANELMEEGKYEQAEPHIGHPVEELYGNIEGQLSERNVPEFKTTLNELHDLSKAGSDKPETKETYNEAMESIDGAIASLPENERNSPEFVLNVINEMLKTAAAEYSAAIANGKVVELVEYQDSRGFVLYSNSLLESIAEPLKQQDPQKYEAIAAKLQELQTAWPSVNPPETLIKTPEEVNALVSEIELQS